MFIDIVFLMILQPFRLSLSVIANMLNVKQIPLKT